MGSFNFAHFLYPTASSKPIMIISSLLILLAVLIANTSHQRIVPATGRYIELSANNKGKVSDYTFHFNLE